jgi:hypothetical protein
MSDRLAEADQLRQLADQVAVLTDDVLSTLASSQSQAGPADVAALSDRLVTVTALQASLESAVRTIGVASGHADRAGRFGAAAWPARREELLKALGRDLTAGTSIRIQAWCVALLEAEWDEAFRLADEDIPIGDELAWLPERLFIATDAVRLAARSPAISLPRLAELFDVLEGDELVELQPSQRISLLTLHARLAVLAAADQAADRLALAWAPLDGLDRSMRTPARDALLAVSSLAQRNWVTLPVIGSSMSASQSTPANTWQPAQWMAALQPRASADLGCTVEFFLRSTEDQPDVMSNLVLARGLAEQLADVVGIDARARALHNPVPDELLIAIAERLVDEDQPDAASALLSSRQSGDPELGYEAALVNLKLVRQQHGELAAALLEVGDRALTARRFDSALDAYREIVEQHDPSSADANRSMADALVCLAAGQRETSQATAELRQALELCQKADELEPVAAASSWSLLVASEALTQLSSGPSPGRPDQLMRALDTSARAVLFRPLEEERWRRLAANLTNIGAFRCANLAAARYGDLAAPSDFGARMRAAHFINAGDIDSATALLSSAEIDPANEPGWLHMLRGTAAQLSSDLLAARLELQAAVDAQPTESSFQERLAGVLSLLPDQDEAARLAWTQLWQQADLDTTDGLSTATWAALELDLDRSARQVAARLAEAERGLAGDQYGAHALGLLAILDDPANGWQPMQTAIDSAIIDSQLRDTARRLKRCLLTRQRHIELGQRYDELIERRCQQIALQFPGQNALQDAQAELDWFQARAAADTGWLDDVRAALNVAGTAIAPAAVTGLAQAMPEVAAALAPSWFAELETAFANNLMLGQVAGARASYEHRFKVTAPRIAIRTEQDCEPDIVLVELPDDSVTSTRIPHEVWYFPRSWQAALTALGELEPAVSASQPDLFALAPPTTALARLALRSPEETAARYIFDTAGKQGVPKE